MNRLFSSNIIQESKKSRQREVIVKRMSIYYSKTKVLKTQCYSNLSKRLNIINNSNCDLSKLRCCIQSNDGFA